MIGPGRGPLLGVQVGEPTCESGSARKVRHTGRSGGTGAGAERAERPALGGGPRIGHGVQAGRAAIRDILERHASQLGALKRRRPGYYPSQSYEPRDATGRRAEGPPRTAPPCTAREGEGGGGLGAHACAAASQRMRGIFVLAVGVRSSGRLALRARPFESDIAPRLPRFINGATAPSAFLALAVVARRANWR